MFDKERLKFALENYKKDFPTRWMAEKYKWEAVKCFQDNWDITATNFAVMLEKSIKKINLKLIYGFAKDVILNFFAKNEPETVRKMFEKLFDDSEDIFVRIADFKESSEELNKKYGSYNKHHQTENTISAYLWLKYPEKYYIYNYEKVQSVIKFLEIDGSNDIKNFFAFYNEICAELKKNSEMILILKNHLTANDYPDSELKTLTIDFGYYIHQNYAKLLNEFQNNVSSKLSSSLVEHYTKENFLSEVYISAEKYDTLAAILKRKKNIILQGAPGVGKTFAAKRLAYSIIGEKNDSQIEFVQFHQNYSYEDFIMGWRPTENNFELRRGIFYNFCKKAEADPDKKFFFIIDEINRGNLSKIFGELLMLIESDKRGKEKIKLAYNDENFSVPENLFIIGMMNTADRSLAIIDYALRRRFSFFEMTPAFDSDGFKKYQTALNSEIFNKLIDKIKILNEKISADNSLGAGFCIGHSYFCGLESCDEKILRSIVDYEILPMLQEYYFDDSATLQDWENILRGVFNE